MTTLAQLTRNARRAFERLPTLQDMEKALNKSGQLLGKYTAAIPDTNAGLRARQQITEAADQWLARCEKQPHSKGE